MYLLVHNLENSVDFVYEELGTCPNFQHVNLISEERHKNVWGGVGRRHSGIRIQRYLGPLREKVNVRVGNRM